MTARHAACACGRLRVSCEGDPVRVSVCHCLECQRRTGSVFGVSARFPKDRVAVEGTSTTWSRPADSGNDVTFHFCPTCGTTVYWRLQQFPDVIAVAVGAFADSSFPSPRHSVYERRRHAWARIAAPEPVQHLD